MNWLTGKARSMAIRQKSTAMFYLTYLDQVDNPLSSSLWNAHGEAMTMTLRNAAEVVEESMHEQ